jgi:Flp pilus assembly protein TadD
VRISAAMIVRDEADHMEACLESLQPFADEICVVDTGSTDATPDIARRFGAKVDTFPWTHDFSEARNRALDLCTGEWLFVIDADERVAPEDVPALLELVKDPGRRGYRFVTRNYTDQTNLSEFHTCPPGEPMARGFRGWTPSTKVRLFPNGLGVHFEGAVHELVNASLERLGVPLVDAPLPIHHYPLLRDAERLRQKQELYLALGQKKIADNPDSAKAYLELGNQYADLGQAVEAVKAYSEAARRAPRDPVVLRSLGAALHLAGRGAEAERALELSLRIDPDTTEGWRNLGVVKASREDWAGALDCFRHAIDVNPDWAEGYHYLSVALDHSGESEEAAKAAESAVERDPASDAAVAHYLDLMTRLELRPQARETLTRLINAGLATRPLTRALDTLK